MRLKTVIDSRIFYSFMGWNEGCALICRLFKYELETIFERDRNQNILDAMKKSRQPNKRI